ncbi:MAG: DUF1592 domain-containing protein, partial [Planctomycetota bacterium]
PGRHRVTIRGYAFQTDGQPLTFSVNGTSFERGSERPVFGYFEMPAGRSGTVHSITFEADLPDRYMLQIEPHGLNLPNKNSRPPIDKYEGPGLAILDVTLERIEQPWPSRGHELIFADIERREKQPSDPRQRQKSWYVPQFECLFPDDDAARRAAEASLTRLAEAAFRRPVDSSEIASYLALYDSERAGGAEFEPALRTAFTGLLCSPRFLFLDEPTVRDGRGERLDDHALAARLSYFLNRTAPDDWLREAAADGRLSDPAELSRQTERLLLDPRHKRFLNDFTDAWLDLREMDFTAPDDRLFPEFDPYLRWSMPRETRAFVARLIEEDRPIRDLIAPDYALLNARLAELYGIEGVVGP